MAKLPTAMVGVDSRTDFLGPWCKWSACWIACVSIAKLWEICDEIEALVDWMFVDDLSGWDLCGV
jgi:hypothetical protein